MVAMVNSNEKRRIQHKRRNKINLLESHKILRMLSFFTRRSCKDAPFLFPFLLVEVVLLLIKK